MMANNYYQQYNINKQLNSISNSNASNNLQNNVHNKLTICTFNVYGARGNAIYIKKLIDCHDIIYLCEHWLLHQEEYVLKDLCSNHNMYFQAANQTIANKGRPFGGNCWLIHKEILVNNIEFINERISQINMVQNNNIISMIGVYMIYNDGQQDSFIIQNSLFNQLETIYKENNRKYENNINVIVGDFNCDSHRNNKFDKQLNTFMNKNKLISTALIETQLVDYTYIKGINKS